MEVDETMALVGNGGGFGALGSEFRNPLGVGLMRLYKILYL